MAYEKAYSRINWENEPSVATPLNETNLNKEDSVIDILDSRIVAMDSRLTGLEDYEPTVLEYMQRAETAAENAEDDADLSRSYAVGTNSSVRQGDAIDNAKYYKEQAGTSATAASTSATNASNSADTARSYAVGTNNVVRVGDSTDNAKYYKEQAGTSATVASTSASNALTSEQNANASELAAKASEDAAALSESNAATSEQNALASKNAAATSETNAANSASDSEQSAQDSEAYAVGKRDGVDVENIDIAYHNNAKYYANLSDENGEAWAIGKRGGVDVPSTDETYHNNSKYYAEKAPVDAQVVIDNAKDELADIVELAESYTEDSESWAVGKRGGVPVPITDPAYQNSAKDWADKAKAIANIDIMQGATATADGLSGLVPKPLKGQQDFVLHGDGTFRKSVSDININANNGVVRITIL